MLIGWLMDQRVFICVVFLHINETILLPEGFYLKLYDFFKILVFVQISSDNCVLTFALRF